MRKLLSGATRTASQERIMKMQGRVSPSAKSERRHEAKEKALGKMKNTMPSGEKRHNLDLSKIKKGTKFGVGTFHK